MGAQAVSAQAPCLKSLSTYMSRGTLSGCLLPQFMWSGRHPRNGARGWGGVFICLLGVLLRQVGSQVSRPDWPFHWGFAERFQPVDYSTKRILILGADTVMGSDAAIALRRDCAHLFLITSLPQSALDVVATVNAEPVVAGRCPPGTDQITDWMAGEIENITFAFEATSAAYKRLGGIDITQNFAKLSKEAESRPVA